jgi:ketosteroid isomerase-like protein
LSFIPLAYCEAVEQRYVDGFRRGLDAWNAGDFDAFAQHAWHPEITLYDLPEMPDAGQHVGREAALKRFANYTEPLGRFTLEFEEAVEGPDALVIGAAIRGRSASEIPVQGRIFYVSRYREDRVVELRMFLDRSAALAAADVGEG